jgi:two-component system, LytTR family, response regulator
MTTIIIDDERLARKELRQLLSNYTEIQIIGEAATIFSASQIIETMKPELIFLDINLRGASGFDLLNVIDPPIPQVIFVTAYDEFAIRAFEINALDYLLKPVSPERLAQAINRISSSSTQELIEGQNIDSNLTLNSRIYVRDGDQCWFLTVNDSLYHRR